ncbi:alcohol dehydrogenase GroES-like domain-containing protein [Colletotrichum costaricense]|uniref:Alcohol dehydrogenase GroES-like domain-containing protein n=1 Tax=Colletotrichum costaricense TaxID=1209916 RepID=A0AAI9YLU8_9PEZI|nr:alcohol dehydrogenase GroES-like domain-containing protein [Colletotrichum costaricense]KAK1515343.1 alcohol dehydrogenase GroES-like domain-containing protein [Colletotrichum costaricense]
MTGGTQLAWAVVEHGEPLRKIQLPIPEPVGTEVLVKVTHCGVCHTDLHIAEGSYDLGEGERMYVKDRGITLPRALGHEIVGIVARLGPDVSPKEAILGASRVVYPWVGCQKCDRCMDGDDNICAAPANRGSLTHGGFAQYITVPHPRYLVDYGNVDPALACTYGCSGLTVLSSIQKLMPLRPTDPILIIGAGGLGLAAISMLLALGHEHTIVADVSVEKLNVALKAGATAVIDSSTGDAIQNTIAAAGRPLAGAIDFVCNQQTTAFALGSIGKGGKVVAVGIMGGSARVPMVPFILTSKSLLGNMVGTVEHLRKVAEIAQSGRLKPIPITNVPWEQANEAMQLLGAGKVAGRLVLVHE